ncbi:Transmembrane transcriptional regulator (anti-sigma factor RsiW) [Gracilibacillus orientalis]|uniref:Anti-sigma-W factor RsiW n=1 Tax=Gracilibacillus orientalis TaxID=334253 RepID=A0A1I4LHB2_9BACI|nr:anti-sigma factor [Gracilibacillus orientalis]SFL90193.1 Transmembrane transcriptional regulator (anti-sigma factor RsiW) [Gracilibacillus orientalis]
MKCNKEIVELMHQYLDGAITETDEQRLRSHLQSCEACQTHFQELKRTVALVTANIELKPSKDFTSNVMAQLPKEKKRMSAKRWMKLHPMLTAAAIFFILMFSGTFSAWNQDQHQLSYPKGQNLIVENDTVIVPKDVVIEDDLEIKNANVKVEGKVLGDVVLINGKHLSASAGKIAGEIKEVDQIFNWMWYKLKDLTESVFSLD